MRVLFDSNIFISYLLRRRIESPVVQVMHAAILGEFALLLPEELLNEVLQTIRDDQYLHERIREQDVLRLMDALSGVAEMIPRIIDVIPPVTRDPDDDYVVAYATVGEADFLITGDKDLLALGEVGQVRIVNPQGFLRVFQRRYTLS